MTISLIGETAGGRTAGRERHQISVRVLTPCRRAISSASPPRSSSSSRFAHHTALFKLYIIRHLPRPEESGAQDPAVDFCSHFLPEVRKALFSGQPTDGRTGS